MQKEDEDTKDYFDRFKNQVEVIENNGGKLGNKKELIKQDKIFKDLSEKEQQDQDNINLAIERTRENFLAYGILAGCDKRDLEI